MSLPIWSVAALLLPLTAGVAFARDETQTNNPTAVILCDGGRCEGTDGRDTIVASNKPEEILGGAGDDDIELDVVFLSGSSDVAIGGPGRDCIDGGAGGDLMIGGPGDDNRPCEFTAFVDPLAALTGGPGDDRIEGGPGDDTMNGIFDATRCSGARAMTSSATLPPGHRPPRRRSGQGHPRRHRW